MPILIIILLKLLRNGSVTSKVIFLLTMVKTPEPKMKLIEDKPGNDPKN